MDVLNYQDGGHNLFTYNHHNNNSNTTKRPHSLHLPYNLNFDGHHDFEYIVPQNATQSSPHYLDRYSTPLGSSQLPGKSLSTDYNYRYVLCCDIFLEGPSEINSSFGLRSRLYPHPPLDNYVSGLSISLLAWRSAEYNRLPFFKAFV